MADHLPECFLDTTTCRITGKPHEPTGGTCYECAGVCICDRLRQAEQRVRTRRVNKAEYRQAYRDGKEDGYEMGVQAARDAVAALDLHRDSGTILGCVYVPDALAAIDALRGDHE